MLRRIDLAYGTGQMTVEVPEENIAWIAGPKDMPAVEDVSLEVLRALKSPVGMRPLCKLIQGKRRRVALLVDDMTRTTPQRDMLPPIVSELNQAGIWDEDIVGIICLGTHRPMTQAEIHARYGEDIAARIRFVNHDCYDLRGLVEVTNPISGTPILVNRIYYESDMSIAVGNIVPHMYAGWSGGAKMIQPGVCGAKTTGETHFMAAERVHEILGEVDNPVRADIEAIARLTGLTMIVNAVLNSRHEMVAAVAGDPVLAHRAGVDIARDIYVAEVDGYCDIAVVSAHPADLDFWQSIKALNAGAKTVRPGGTVIVLAEDREGISPDHPELCSLGTASAEQAKSLFDRGEITDKVALSTYLAMNVNRSRARIILVSHAIDKRECMGIGIEVFADAQRAIEEAMRTYGPKARIGIMHQGADLCPIVRSQRPGGGGTEL